MANQMLNLVLVPKYDNAAADFGEGDGYMMGNYLVEYFTPSLRSTKFSSVDYTYEPDASAVTSDDLVCYVLPRQRASLILRKYPTLTLGQGGSTIWSPNDNAVISEVYLDSSQGDADRARLMANLIFHEWLHNRLDAGPHIYQDVHATPHGVLTTSGGINSNMRPAPADTVSMRRGLVHPHAQYTGGF